MLSTDALIIFAKVGELGSLSGAARLLKVPKANISRAIGKLERDYGTVLLERTTRGVRLTEVGKLVQFRASRIAEEVASAQAEVAAYRGEPAGTLRIGCPALLGSLYLSPRLPDFLAQYPKIDLHLHLADRLAPNADRFDAVLHAGFLGDSSYISRKIVDIELTLVATPEYLERRGLPLTPDDLAQHTIMHAQEPPSDVGELPVLSDDQVIVNGSRRHTLKFDNRVQTNDPIFVDALMRRGECLILASRVAMAEDLKAGRVVEVLPDWRLQKTPAIYALHTFRSAVPAKLRVFLDFVEKLGRGTWHQPANAGILSPTGNSLESAD